MAWYVVRCCVVVLAVMLAGCGQPLQLNSPSAARPTQPARQPSSSAVVLSTPPTATRVPSEAAATPLPAEEPATSTGTVSNTATLPAGTALASPTSAPDVVIVLPTPTPLNNQERWRAQEIDRQVLETAQTYIAKNPVPLLWYDPLAGQSLEIGTLVGEFTVQARFTLRGSNSPALEVPYRINVDYGLTSISDAVRERMQAAGYTESVEAYVVEVEGVVPK